MIDFTKTKAIKVPEGSVIKIVNAKGAVLWERAPGRLPAEYQEVEYLQSSGTQWIDTGFVLSKETLTNGVRAVSKIALLNTSGNKAMYKNRAPYFFVGSSGKVLYSGLGTTYYASKTNNDNEPHVLTLDSTEKTFLSDGELVTRYTFSEYPEGSGNLYLFNVSGGSFYLTAKLYYTKIYYQGELALDFVPCYRTKDGKPGMYEIVNGTFFANNGTGEFVYGEEVV